MGATPVTDIRVNPASVRQYAGQAQESFQQVHKSLENLVNDVTQVNYYGPNATQFKGQCQTTAVEFAEALNADVRNIIDAVRNTTSSIAGSLGGGPISIEYSGGSVSAPAIPQGDGESVGANLPALEALADTVATHFNAIGERLTAHLQALNSTDWTGNAKESAVSSVTRFTNDAQGKVDEASQKISQYIRDQVADVRSKDSVG